MKVTKNNSDTVYKLDDEHESNSTSEAHAMIKSDRNAEIIKDTRSSNEKQTSME